MADVIDALIAEALGEGPEGIAAVAHVINQRALAEGKTPDEIINESGQFSGVTNPGRVVRQSLSDPAIRQQVSEIWNGVQSGSIPNPYPGATHFHTPAVSPNWSNSFERLGQQGNHIFYSDGTPAASPPAPRRVEPSMPVDRPTRTAVAAIEQAAPSWDWSQYATGGAAARPDSFTGLADPFSRALQSMLADAPEDVRINITSAYRSPETQERLWKDALAKYGSESEARKWVAPPGRSQHNHGNAVDLKYLSPAAQAWAHENASRYGLAFPLGNEPWHLELGTARGGPVLAYNASPQPAPPAPQGGGFWANPLQSLQGATASLAGPLMASVASPQMQQAAIGPLMSTAAGRNMISRQIQGMNIGAAPQVTQGHTGMGTLATAVNSRGANPVTLSGRNNSSSSGAHGNMNMDVYRANAATLGGRNFNQQSINDALSRGKTLYKLA